MRYATSWFPILVVLCSFPALGEPAFRNGDFELGSAGWGWSQQETARGEFRVVASDSPAGGKAGQVTVTTPGPAHRLQLMHEFSAESLVPGKGYVLRFYAKAVQPTAFQVLLMNRDKPWQNLGVRRGVSLGTQWQCFRFAFRARKSEQAFGKVDFFLGETEGTVRIDGVAIEAYDPKTVVPDGPVLTTKAYTVQFFKTGAIARLVHTASGRAVVEPGEDRAAYELTLTRGGADKTLSGDQAASLRSEPLPGGAGYRFIAEHPQVTVTLVYRTEPKTGMLECRGAVSNKSDAAVTRFTFPILHAPESLGNTSADDTLLYSVYDGVVVDDPKTAFRSTGRSLSGAYPGPLSCQVMAFCDPEIGLYVASHDPDGYPKVFTVDLQFQMRLSVTHLAPAVAGADLEPSYPVVVGPFVGDRRRGGTSWYDAAEIYRRWSQRQPWAQRKVRTRADTPDWLRAGALVTFYNPRRLTPPGDLSKLEAFLNDYTTRFTTPLLPNNRGFERYGTWCGQEYLPVMPDEATFRRSAELAKKLGGRSMVMLSGYRWTIERTTPEGERYSSRQRFDREVARWAVHDRTGKPVVATSDKPNDFRGRKWSRMCRATELAKTTIVEASKYFVRNGYSVVHFDQECSGAYDASVCWAEDHGHPPGDGRWVHLAMADLYQRISEACRPLDPDFMLSMEEPNELYLPWLNLCQSRPFGITPEWPVVAPATRSVPLFLYLYHENLIGWAAFYPWKSAGRPCYSLAKGFSIGQMPGLVPPQNLRGMAPEQHQRFMTLFANCMTAYRTFAHDYLVWGRMQRPLTLDIPERTLSWGRNQTLRVPAVSHAVWSLDDGRVGAVFVNPEPQPHTLALDLSPLIVSHPIAGEGGQAAIREVSTRAGQRMHTSPRLTITIPPLDLLLLECMAPEQQETGAESVNGHVKTGHEWAR